MVSEVLAVIRELAKQGLTMLIVTHEMDFARDVSDQVYVFAEGNVVEFGPPKDVFADPRHPITKAFLKVA
jgi:polar amino acid transport system ATP-binding protein